MNFKALKKYFLKKQIKKHLKENVSDKNFSELRTVGLLVNTHEYENLEAFNGLVKSLEILNKDLKMIFYKEEKRNLPTFVQNNFSSKDFNWKGVLTKPAIEEFLDREYDLFIGYYSKKNSYLDYITSRAKAKLKVGLIQEEEDKFFDIVFKLKVNEFSLFEKELAKYIKIFKYNKKQ
jgi:hypothetical protein